MADMLQGRPTKDYLGNHMVAPWLEGIHTSGVVVAAGSPHEQEGSAGASPHPCLVPFLYHLLPSGSSPKSTRRPTLDLGNSRIQSS